MIKRMETRAEGRLDSLDTVRGLVMVLMAIDHVRVYSGVAAGGTDPAIFFTRWITHFCAPAFALLAGMGAYLHGKRLAGAWTLARYLVIRGLILVALELTVIRFFWTFNFDYSGVLAGVIWMLGWCMVLLAGLVWLPSRVVGFVGIFVIALQQLFSMMPKGMALGWLWEFVYPAGFARLDGVSILYVLVPWIGVIALGYGLGEIASRRRWLLWIGCGATALFAVLAGVALMNAPAPANVLPPLLRALNQRKYPASQLYLLMTLGPTLIALALLGKVRVLSVFGRVPMFYYLLHIPAIHLAALAVGYLHEGAIYPERYSHAPFTQVPAAQVWSLPLLYLVFAVVVTGLYFPCRWFADLKRRQSGGWLRFI